MLFNSFEYLIFLPIIVGLFFALPHRFRWAILLAGSYFFYMYWRPEYGLILLFSTTIDYFAAIQMHRSTEKNRRKLFLWISVCSNLGLLFAFKYFGFFNEMAHNLFSVFDYSKEAPSFDILLPIGISFYTFQTLSYSIDVYRKRREPEYHFGIFALYVSFFPQLVAGPIERSTRLLPQFRIKKHFDLNRFVEGSRLIVWGLFKKIILADTLGHYVNLAYGDPMGMSDSALLISTVFFCYQMYIDFSAYTDIAIGSAKILGFDLMSNFERPLRSKSMTEFWGRWHISLTSWLYDYVFRPMAKNVKVKWYLNVLIIFFLLGLWHGAGLNFIVFGLMIGAFYLISVFLLESGFTLLPGKYGNRFKWLGDILKNLFVMGALMLSGIFLRAENLEEGWYVFTHIFNGLGQNITGMEFALVDLFIILTAFPIFLYVQTRKKWESKNPFTGIRYIGVRWGIYYLIIFYLIMFGQRPTEEFLYFQF